MVRDLSLSGLSILTSLELGQGDGVDIVIEGGVPVQALAWRIRRVADGQLVGLMLSEVGAGYQAMVARVAVAAAARRKPVAAPASAAAARAPSEPPAESPEACTWWSVRVKETGGSRTRAIKLAAADRDQAVGRALAELGPGWTILAIDVTRPAA